MEMNKKLIFKVDDFIRSYGQKIFLQDIDQAILCFSSSLAKKLSTKYDSQRVFALGGCFDIYKDFKTVVVSQFGFGASGVLLPLEHLRSLGVKKFISFGSACSLSAHLKVAQGVFIEKAYNNLIGSSYYGADSKCVNKPLSTEDKKKLQDLGLVSAVTWTSDVPYREADLDHILSQGVTCLEMEASAMLSFAEFYSLKMLCIAFISDFIDHQRKWHLHFNDSQLKKIHFTTLEKLVKPS